MADQTTGGDGSVRWSLTADNVDPIFVVNNHAGSGKGRHYQAGIDDDGAIGSWFTISVKKPVCMDRDVYLAALQSGVGDLGIKPGPGADRVQFKLRIEASTPEVNDIIRLADRYGRPVNSNFDAAVYRRLDLGIRSHHP